MTHSLISICSLCALCYLEYGKIPKISPGVYFLKAPFEGLIFGGAYIRRGLSTEGNLRFKVDWASLIVRSKFTVFALFYFVFEGNFPSTSPEGGGGGRACIWRALYTEGITSEFYGIRRPLVTKWNYTWRNLEIACNKLSSIK